ncbi:CBN-DDO-2 protein [Caenorhabditis brenneri]|uniref:CBN-DDO-2 protein n=1 Tax=Caenorhabditis brenneri TaxID=135651 RepID=G0N0V6_CAEBE|nr:CBN-DDO-2 protein [Caenorhabditis brenneri]
MIPKIAVIGEGVIGCTSALQIAKAIPNSRITILHDKPFEKSCSAGPAGLFRIDYEENTHCIHHTAYASEGNKYVPYLKNLLLEQKVEFKQQEVKSLDEVADSGYDVIVNCAGLYAYMGSRVIMQHVNFPFLR